MSEFELSRMFVALMCLLGAAHAFGYLFERFSLPRVVGEITGGILLGPTLLGRVFPELYDAGFSAFPAQADVLSAFYWLGLTALMFVSGFRVQRHLESEDRRVTFGLIAAATILPFVAGFSFPHFVPLDMLAGPAGNSLALALVAAIAFSVTSIPVISKIFLDLKIIDTRFARIVISAATIQDLILWVGLSVALGISQGNGEVDVGEIAQILFKTIVFLGIAITFGPRFLTYLTHMRLNFIRKASPTGYLFFVCFLVAALASFFSINIVFGALVAGVIVGATSNEELNKAKDQISTVSVALFIPIYFALVGLKIDLPNHFDLLFTLAFIVISSIIEVLCVVVGMRIIGRDMRSSVNFGIAMNTRGGPGIVLASVALHAGIIGDVFYVTLVMAALLTSLVSGIWFRYLLRSGRNLM
mgnify:CR=1 FL=1|jgi:Kef-type K+ transport system membrane component KefB